MLVHDRTAGILAGLFIGAFVACDAVQALRSAPISGAELAAIAAVWLLGIVTTACGAGLLVYLGIGFARLSAREKRVRRADAPRRTANQ
ncbi:MULTISPECIES: hypothetical protein [Roseomonadaceae]|uniref:Uncharacterized protein n=1 Tax=Falsiroseomonas oleicola TaxID=2801474 RepID=A0ABS6HCE1_9PROT|nr:hypothetical protein [Roseomonas oleicola]MBU8546089.1 hypothetical protein [Roseomonas oleicola]